MVYEIIIIQNEAGERVYIETDIITQSVIMDEVFKSTYEIYAFSLLPELVDSEWQDQVLKLTELWEKVQPLINKEKNH